MHRMPVSVRPGLRRLARRLAIGLFLEMWSGLAVASLLLAGLVALVCRLFVPGAATLLPWFWLAPAVTALPVIAVCYRRAYRPDEIVAIADSLAGGQGVLMTLQEKDDPAWAGSPLVDHSSKFVMPRLRPWRKLAAVAPSAAFLAIVLWLPQRTPAGAATAALADDIAADLTTAVVELKQQSLITPDEEKRLQEEIERIRRSAQQRVDSSSWEAADALREKIAADLAAKQDAVKWAEASLARFAAATESGAPAPGTDAASAELMKALEKLASSGLLAGAPPDLQQALQRGKFPADAKSLQQLAASLAKHLAGTSRRVGEVARLGKEAGRFNPAEFPLAGGDGEPAEGEHGQGGINRGRGDAELTWGQESAPFDRFKAQPLPPGAVRSPDDWAPLVELPGAPKETATLSTPSIARQYADAAGQTAWRRNLAPRHRSAVKKYFDK